MRNYGSIIFAALVMSASACLSVLALSGSPADGGLVVESPVHDFGTVPPTTLTHEFKLRNASRHPIELLHSLKSCGCTSVVMPARRLQPGESATARCEVDTRGRRGPFNSRVTVVYWKMDGKASAADGQSLQCSLRATVDPVVDVLPDELAFAIGKSEGKRLTLSSSEPGVKALGARSDHAAITAAVRDDGAIEVTFDSRRWADAQGETKVDIQTSSATENVIRIPVRILAPQ